MHRFRSSLASALLVAAAACGTADPESRPVTSSGDGAAPSAAATDPQLARADLARVRGAESAPIWIIEVSDFQCPYCAQFHRDTYEALSREYIETGKARLAYVNLPLPNHQHAMEAAEAAMCAGAQGKFWPMHDVLFTTQPRWSGLATATSFFDSLATTVGVSLRPWRACMSSNTTRPLIENDYQRAVQSGVRATPSFLIVPDSAAGLGSRTMSLSGAQPIDAFRRTIDVMLARRDSQPQTSPR